MSDLSITAASVVKSTDAVLEQGYAGETITAGQPVYRDESTKLYKKADNNSATAAAKIARGIALNGGAVNQPIMIQKGGDITIGATLTAGARYYLSATAGGISPEADLGAGQGVCLLGLAKSTTVLTIDIQAPGVTL